MAGWKSTLIGGGIGWTLGGPIGALIGMYVGNMFTQSNNSNKTHRNFSNNNNSNFGQSTKPGDFAVSLLVLFAAVTKADKKVLSDEIQYIKQYLVEKFGVANAQEMMYLYKDILNKDFDLYQVCNQINRYLDHYSKLEMLHILFGIANADRVIHKLEIEVISKIANYLGISVSEYNSIKAVFVKQDYQHYKILDINENASDDEIKKTYKNLAVKFHPDKVAHLGSDLQKVAEEKFKIINNAYQSIRQQRGF